MEAEIVVRDVTRFFHRRNSRRAVTVTRSHLRIYDARRVHDFRFDESTLISSADQAWDKYSAMFPKDYGLTIRYFVYYGRGQVYRLPSWLRFTPRSWASFVEDVERAQAIATQPGGGLPGSIYRG